MFKPTCALLVAAILRLPSAVGMPACPGNTTATDILATRDLTGKVAIVTGGDSGLGYATAEALAKQNATVIIGNRNQTHGEMAAKNISALTGAEVVALHLDLGSLASVRDFAAAVHEMFGPQLHILINNAGIGFPSVLSADGFELVFEVDYLGHFLLTELMLPALRASKPSRVVNVASASHEEACSAAGWPEGCFKDFTYFPPPAVVPPPHTFIGPTYGVAKFLQIQHARGLALREAGAVEAFSINPGFVLTAATSGFDPSKTPKGCNNPGPGLPAQACPFSAAQGAAVTALCATSSSVQTGVYYDRKLACQEGNVVEHGFTEAMVPELYERSLQLLNLTSSPNPPSLAQEGVVV